jgi:hypothetical protein
MDSCSRRLFPRSSAPAVARELHHDRAGAGTDDDEGRDGGHGGGREIRGARARRTIHVAPLLYARSRPRARDQRPPYKPVIVRMGKGVLRNKNGQRHRHVRVCERRAHRIALCRCVRRHGGRCPRPGPAPPRPFASHAPSRFRPMTRVCSSAPESSFCWKPLFPS